MDGTRGIQRLEGDRPIAKPDFPLPMVFTPAKMSELSTKPQTRERAYFYRKETGETSSPVYGFVITTEPVEHHTGN